MTVKKDFKATVENGGKQNTTKLFCYGHDLCLCVIVYDDYLLWRLDLKGVTFGKLHNNPAKRHLNKYKSTVTW